MSEESFTFTKAREDNADNASGHSSCPLEKIPLHVWSNLLKPPFRKRHPLIFWLSVIFFLCVFTLITGRILKVDLGAPQDTLAFVSIKGPIISVGPTLNWIRQISTNPAVKGVLLRIDSPGGGAAASQEIYSALERLAKKMPIAVSMGATAASGGLMVAMCAERIFANASTITGSIGVRMDIPQLQGLMGKIGIGQETLVTAPFKDAASLMRPLTPEDREYLQGVIENMHEQFVDIVARGRKMPRERASQLANGKIFTGQRALELGLIDELGGQDAAHDWLARRAGIPVEAPLLNAPSERSRLLTSILNLGDSLADGDFMNILGGKISGPAFLYQ